MLAGWDVGLLPLQDGTVEVWLAKLLIGHIDPSTASFKAMSPPPPSHPSRRGAIDKSHQPQEAVTQDEPKCYLCSEPKVLPMF